ncbi:MAG: transcription elongation factor GreA [Acidimicrobiia bacterium]
MEQKIRLSQAAIESLRAELDRLVHEIKPVLIERVGQARAHGDLSENADYHAAREELAKIEGRIRELEQRLKSAAPAEIVDDGIVSEGKIVVLRLDSGGTREFLIAAREEKSVLSRDTRVSLVSPNAPLGSACLGRKAGDTVEYETPSGRMRAEILEVKVPQS